MRQEYDFSQGIKILSKKYTIAEALNIAEQLFNQSKKKNIYVFMISYKDKLDYPYCTISFNKSISVEPNQQAELIKSFTYN